MTLDAPLGRFVRRLQLRSDLAHEACEALLGLGCTLATSKRGGSIQDPGRSGHLTIVVEGVAARCRTTRTGRRQVLSFHMAGDPLDLQDRYLSQPRDRIEAIGPVKVARVRWAALDRLAGSHPDLRSALWRDALAECSTVQEWLARMGCYDAEARIAQLICELALRANAVGVGDLSDVAWPFRQDMIAEATGLTAIHVNRMLRRLRERGLAAATGGTVHVNDWERLRNFAKFDDSYLGFRNDDDVSDSPLRLEPKS